MLILPYKLQQEGKSLWTLWLFLSNGKTVWETDEEKCSEKFILDNYLTPNGLFGKSKIIGNTLFCELNEKTDINNFYTWTEFLKKEAEIPKVDLFRPFCWVGDSIGEKDDWGWYEECEEVTLGKAKLIDLWSGVKAVRGLRE
jgi:hypothetical protein